MQAAFWKMHGAGNDFVVMDARTHALPLSPGLVAQLADRRTGIGCDQFITMLPAPAGADVLMRIQNPDGGEAGACGNATRCVASLLAAELGRDSIVVRTVAGDLGSQMLGDGRVRVDMGQPRLDWRDVPLAHAADTLHLDLPGDPAACSMGNPHATFFVADAEAHPVGAEGLRFEHDALFPDRANIGFAQVLAPDRLRLRVWERGAGLTLACGSGACATLVNAARRGLTGRRAEILVDGGMLEIEWRADDHVLMTGPVATSFIGTIQL
jgi:diaminopimelate epimerase